jgi:D-aminoacyl-tRNA deacylase
MRALVQRVSSAEVSTEGIVVGQIKKGLVILLGIAFGDESADGIWLAQKIAHLRIFPDKTGKLNCSVLEQGGEVMVVSQFTLLASTRKGTRPSFNDAAPPAVAVPLYESFCLQMQTLLASPVATGKFGANMSVRLENDGPITLMIDSKRRE